MRGQEMNQNLKKIMDELADKHYECTHGKEMAVYCDCHFNIQDDFKEGFTAAIPHVREEIFKILMEQKTTGSGSLHKYWIEEELKRMDENE